MATIKKRFTEDSYKKEPWFRALCGAMKSCETEEDMANFLRDIGTLSELQAWSERLEVAKQLSTGTSYRVIAKNTGASTTTVTRVAKFLENGQGGYRKILNTHRHHRLQKPDALEEKLQAVKDRVLDYGVKNAESHASAGPKPVSVLQKYLQK
ncbi:MAG: TrpR-related protein YerC/YecD [Candidatus Peribacteria bacterium]|nr:TrpR-related protein YerC/YecD [Candidatus Peribacteria bacterium]